MKQSRVNSVSCRTRGAISVRPGSLAWMAWLVACLSSTAAESTNLMVKPPVPLPGGLGLHPVITSVVRTQDLVTVQWFGIQGPFQVLHSSAVASNDWEKVGPLTFGSSLTAQVAGDNGFFRVLSGRPTSTSETGGTLDYVGALACVDCHADTVQQWAVTPHANAFKTLQNLGQENNSRCLPCHTVGFGTPLGFESAAGSPHLTDVQCENCHGPAANHIAVVRDASVRPKVTAASEVCGGCHNYHHPTYDEWKASPHAEPLADVTEGFIQQGEPRMMQCGPCHSTAVRVSLLQGLGRPSVQLPNRIDAAAFAETCTACHDPHLNMPDPPRLPDPMLRNPLYSLDNYSYAASTNVLSFAAQYNPAIQLCGQCHNMRGARWQDTSRPPHHSPQYNLLIGQGAYDLGLMPIAAHGLQINTQCVHCHRASLAGASESSSPAQGSASYFGHTTAVDIQSCVICHITTVAAEQAVSRTQERTQAQIAELKALLDQWATTRAPTALREKYGTLAWEYNVPGDLSNPSSDPTLRGPTSTEQAQVPDAIKQARFNLYLVQYDGSFGVHNGEYARTLLGIAKTNVMSQLTAP